MVMGGRKIVIPCAALSALLLFACNVFADQPKRYLDSERGFSLIVPANWSVERFGIEPSVLRIESHNGDYVANCSFTVVTADNFPNVTQEWLDKAVNSVAQTSIDQKLSVQKMQKMGSKIFAHYATIQTIGGRKANALFYSSSTYSSKIGANIYTESFFINYVRPKDQVGVTCFGGGLSFFNAHSSFEHYNSEFQGILASIKFPSEKEKVQEAVKPEPQRQSENVDTQSKLKDEAKQKEQAEQAMIEEQKIKVEYEQANVVAKLRPNPKAELEKTEQERVRAEQSAATAGDVVEYTTRIIAKIRRNILMPRNIPSNVIAEFEVTLMPDGMVSSAKLVKPSGIAAYDRVVKRAIIKAQPLPVPTDMALFNKFRELHLKFRPVKER